MKTKEEIMAREEKELTSLRKKSAIPIYAGYIFVLYVITTMIHVIDEITSNISANVQSSVVTEFFVMGKGMTFNEGLSAVSAMSALMMIISLVAPFYKVLSDRYGRKPFLVINTLGMAIGMLVCVLAKSYILYFIGVLIAGFFVAHDMQVIYILEVAPPDKRARFFGITKAIGTLGIVLIPIMRSVFMGNDPTQWRMVYIVPIIITAIFACIAFFFAKESDVFLKQRISYLETPLEERLTKEKEEKELKKANKEKSGVFSAFKYIFQNKELKWIAIAMFLYFLSASGMTGYYESIMHTAGMSTENITKALYLFSFMFAGVIFIAGFMGDSIGRKPTAVILGALCIVMFILFVASANAGWNPYIVGIFYGLYLGSFWQASDYLMIIASEKAPTSIRSSVLAATGLLTMLGFIFGIIYMTISLNFLSISSAVLFIAIPTIVVSMIILLVKVTETKGVDLTMVGKETA